MTKKFSRLENVILILATAALLGLLYYQFVYRPLQDARVRYDTSDLDSEIELVQMQISKIRNLEEAAEESKKNNLGYVGTYSSQKQEIRELNDIFADALAYSFTFDDPVADGDIVRRNFAVTYSADSYPTAKEIMRRLYEGKYRCQIGSISFSPTSIGTVNIGNLATLDLAGVQVSMTLTFYETLYDAKTTRGVEVPNQDVDTGNDVLNQLANEKSTYENMGN